MDGRFHRLEQEEMVSALVALYPAHPAPVDGDGLEGVDPASAATAEPVSLRRDRPRPSNRSDGRPRRRALKDSGSDAGEALSPDPAIEDTRRHRKRPPIRTVACHTAAPRPAMSRRTEARAQRLWNPLLRLGRRRACT